jgi:hypothetical protein
LYAVPALVGVPDSRPVVLLNVAHEGWFQIPNEMVSPSASVAVGVNEYGVPTTAVVGGVPEIVGTAAYALLAINAATSAKTINEKKDTKGLAFRE